MSTFDEVYGPDPNAPKQTQMMAGPGTVAATVPAVLDTNLKGLSSLHPGKSPTPWVIGMAVVLLLLLHEKAGFNVGGKASVKL